MVGVVSYSTESPSVFDTKVPSHGIEQMESNIKRTETKEYLSESSDDSNESYYDISPPAKSLDEHENERYDHDWLLVDSATNQDTHGSNALRTPQDWEIEFLNFNDEHLDSDTDYSWVCVDFCQDKSTGSFDDYHSNVNDGGESKGMDLYDIPHLYKYEATHVNINEPNSRHGGCYDHKHPVSYEERNSSDLPTHGSLKLVCAESNDLESDLSKCLDQQNPDLSKMSQSPIEKTKTTVNIFYESGMEQENDLDNLRKMKGSAKERGNSFDLLRKNFVQFINRLKFRE